jgi:hypothetical protein
VVARFKAICLHFLCVSEENHEGLQDVSEPRLEAAGSLSGVRAV